MEGGVVALVDMPPAGSALIVPCEIEGEQRPHAWSPRAAPRSSSTRPRAASRAGSRSASAIASRCATSPRSRRICPRSRAARRAHQGAPRREPPSPHPRHVRSPRRPVRRAHDRSAVAARREPHSALLRARRGHDDARADRHRRSRQGRSSSSTRRSPSTLALDKTRLWKKAGVDPKTARPSHDHAEREGGAPQHLPPRRHRPPERARAVARLRRPTSGAELRRRSRRHRWRGLLEAFRVTFADEGRFAWLEPDPAVLPEPPPPNAPPGAPPATTAPPPAPTYTPAPVTGPPGGRTK